MTESTKNRNDGVDLLRGIAILLVLILHFHLTYRLQQTPLTSAWLADSIKAVARNGNYGVTMFFAVSGFLITSTSVKRFGAPGRIDLISFYGYRVSRILPCLVLALSLMVLLSLAGMRSFVNKPDTVGMGLAVVSVLTFWHNVLMAKVGYFNYAMNILWSLSVEEVFYLTFPAICLILRRPRAIIAFLFIPIVAAPIYRSLHSQDEIVALYGYLSCFDAIAMGCCAALLAKPSNGNARTDRAIRVVAGCVIAAVYLSGPIMKNVVWGVSVVAACTSILLYRFRDSGGRIAQSVAGKLVRWFGVRSYELYLFHIIVLGIMREYVTRETLNVYAKPFWLVLFIMLSALAANLVFRFFSEPVNTALRRGLFRSRRNLSETS
jgi:peptidoglycan/LPS O-acetylase OafA/YrhL